MSLDSFKTDDSKEPVVRITSTADMWQESFELGYTIGVILGDGCVRQGREGSEAIILQVTDKEFACYFGRIFCKWSGLVWNSWDENELSTNGPITRCGNASDQWRVQKGIADIYDELNYYQIGSWSVDELVNTSDELKSGLIKGLWDSEGSVARDRPAARFSNSDIQVINLFLRLCFWAIGLQDCNEPLDVDKGSQTIHSIKISGIINDSTRNVTIPSEYLNQFYHSIEPITIRRKNCLFKNHLNV